MSRIESILTESRVFEASEQVVNSVALDAQSIMSMYEKAEQDHVGFWSDLAREKLNWSKPFTVGLDDSEAPHFKWFTDGELNVSYNCIDRHLENKSDKLAIIFEGDDGHVERYTYKELHDHVCRFANTLVSMGVQKGERVVLYMPMIPQAVIAMQACARIGAIHSVVFGGFSADSLLDRIEDAGAKLVITANGGYRGGKIISLKKQWMRLWKRGGIMFAK